MRLIAEGLTCVVVAGLGIASPAALAQEIPSEAEGSSPGRLQDIVVTAQKRSENLQDIPVSVNAFSGADLQSRGITNVQEITAVTSGLQLSPGNGVLVPFLRGIGNSANAVGNESSVALYVDGVYYTRLPTGFFSLGNIERVEVLKGPQGTLFGRNSSGGVIQVVTRDPSHTASGSAHVGYGNYDTVRADFYATTGITDTVALDISTTGTRQDNGYGINTTTGNPVGFQNDATIRSKLLFEPSESTKIVVSGFYSYSRSSQFGNTYPGTTQGHLSAPFTQNPRSRFYDQNSDIDNSARASSYGGTLRIEQELGSVTLASITAVIREKEHNVYDLDYGRRPDARADLFAKINQTTQELQLSSSSGSPLNWIVGLFYYNTLSRYDPLTFQGPAFAPGDSLSDGTLSGAVYESRQRAKSYAAYGQGTYEVAPGLKLTGGLRYSMDRLSGSGSLDVYNAGAVVFAVPAVSDKDKVNKLTWKAAVGYEVAPDINLYASYSRGYKSASFTLAPFTPTATKPEVLDAYEVGLKTELFDRRVRLNAAAFWYDVKNPQVQLLNSSTVTNSNAGASRVKGAEVEGSILLAEGLTVNFGATYLDAKYRDYGNAPSGPVLFVPPFGSTNPLLSIDASGNNLPLAPKFNATLGLQYNLKSAIGDWTASTDYNYNDGFYWEPDNLLRQGSYHIVNAQLRFEPNKSYSISVWGKNLVDEKYAGFAATQAGPSGYPYAAAAPRTYGATFGFQF
jgi:iron complex outermembrane receptor protein